MADAAASSGDSGPSQRGGGPQQKRKRRSGPKSKSSPFVGVTQYKRTGNWEAHIWIQNPKAKGFQRHLGSYQTAEIAARVYDRAALKFRGAAAETNFPHEEYAQDDFMRAHERTDRFKFLDLLRERFGLKTSGGGPAAGAARPPPQRRVRARQQRGGRADDDDDEETEEEGERPTSPRTRTVVRMPPGAIALAAALVAPGPQRITVHERPLALPPPPPARQGGQRQQGQRRAAAPEPAAPLLPFPTSSGGGGGGLVRQHSGAASEEPLLINFAPVGSPHESLLWGGPGPAASWQAAPLLHVAQLSPSRGLLGSAAATPCSSPGRLLPSPTAMPMGGVLTGLQAAPGFAPPLFTGAGVGLGSAGGISSYQLQAACAVAAASGLPLGAAAGPPAGVHAASAVPASVAPSGQPRAGPPAGGLAPVAEGDAGGSVWPAHAWAGSL